MTDEEEQAIAEVEGRIWRESSCCVLEGSFRHDRPILFVGH